DGRGRAGCCAGMPSWRTPTGLPESDWATCPYPLVPGSAGPGRRPSLPHGTPETLSDRVIIAQYRRNLIIAGADPGLTVPLGAWSPPFRAIRVQRSGSAPADASSSVLFRRCFGACPRPDYAAVAEPGWPPE